VTAATGRFPIRRPDAGAVDFVFDVAAGGGDGAVRAPRADEGTMLDFLKKLLRGRAAEPPAPGENLRTAVAGRKRAEAGQRQSEQHFDQLVAGVRDYAIFLLDPQGNVTTWNAGAERTKGYRPEEIIGQHFASTRPTPSRRAGPPTS
jgi:PAS domain-containing protein